jgi:hypothetical protein
MSPFSHGGAVVIRWTSPPFCDVSCLFAVVPSVFVTSGCPPDALISFHLLHVLRRWPDLRNWKWYAQWDEYIRDLSVYWGKWWPFLSRLDQPNWRFLSSTVMEFFLDFHLWFQNLTFDFGNLRMETKNSTHVVNFFSVFRCGFDYEWVLELTSWVFWVALISNQGLIFMSLCWSCDFWIGEIATIFELPPIQLWFLNCHHILHE